MGFLDNLFGSSSEDSNDDTYAQTNNSAEVQASADYLAENFQTGEDPIPDHVPEWAQNLPTPNAE